MGSGSTRPNTADDKMIAAIERGDQGGFKDSKPPKIKDNTLIKSKEAQKKKTQDKTKALRVLRQAAEKERENK
ncbi:hypothetical protein MTBPR1_260013 [Candidatus Terasakiella magnetica]|uniref:Uncharacterized protein n=1 Tax=Candidatus Terasakiella magnetica TaxID=1867952 RepID=A0A1C3RH84_9PROT|nr:hypothetical protein [Candidatus Terasakiella magnetica]SCA56618.1 hypothetical protein MTBPR1_260013 [Candidatus Terasakiella magnetica]